MENFKKNNTFKFCLLVLASLSISSCAFMKKDTIEHVLINPQKINLANDIYLSRDDWPQARWWTKYADPQLNMLIQTALTQAPSLNVARSRLEQASANVQAVKSSSLPAVFGLGQVHKRWTDSRKDIGPFSLPFIDEHNFGYTTNSDSIVYTAGIGGTYTFDVWGLKSSMISSAIGVQNAQLSQNAAIELELSSNIASLYYEIVATNEQINVTENIKKILKNVVYSEQSRRKQGLATVTDIANSQNQLLEIDKTLIQLDQKNKILRESLRALIGVDSEDQILASLNNNKLPDVSPTLPRDLSYELLKRRPDLVASRWYVEASLGQIDAAKAAFYPQFDIKAFLGINRIELSDIYKITNKQFGLVPGLTLPLFDGGRLNANLKQKRLESNTVIEQYNQSVINAVKEVAIAVTKMDSLQKQTNIEDKQYSNMLIGTKNAEAHYARGLLSRVNLSRSKLPILNKKLEMISTQKSLVIADVELIKALGGGYLPSNNP
ncbi:efflux transporter outer membrane subunit [Acinetobacter faecalis]|uniref:efflux transporter outer membrane subunit n=1 Tax=Acinetobacter faecalis TaxID=2665161 RepID=UPI002A917230|nr:efflux transporter outer membrane subunit [Acinetobacter faecalis]MDY6457338.1 efflux transporter outer membrane subunit [Acinetobacter faecalis]MDY6469305.1 efflux transporter outer membrane subunit [Acinetobacter faecalis]